METLLREKFKTLGSLYVEIPPESLAKIYHLFFEDIPLEPTTGIDYLYLGIYHTMTKSKSELIVTNYLQAAKLGYPIALNNLALYYHDTVKNLRLAKQYYLQAIEQGIGSAAYNLSSYYNDKKKRQLDLFYMKKSATMGHPKAIEYLGTYYRQKSVQEKYLLFGLKHNYPQLIKMHYRSVSVHYLLLCPNQILSPTMISDKQKYGNSLFLCFQQTDTWFKHYCVKDVTGMVQNYVLQ